MLLCAAAAARAEGLEPLEYNLRLDLPVTLVAVSAWVGTEVAKPSLGPSTCRICESNALDAAIRNAVVWRNPVAARHASDALVFGILPAGMLANQLLSANAGGDWKAG